MKTFGSGDMIKNTITNHRLIYEHFNIISSNNKIPLDEIKVCNFKF